MAILWSFRRCPYAMRGRMGLKVSGIDYEHREIILRDKPKTMLDASPKGTVPVFIKDDGNVIEESLDLLHWALSRNDPLGWLDCDLEAANTLIMANDTDFKHHLDRYKYASRYSEDAKRGDTDLSHRLEAEKHIQTLENFLESGPYLLGEKQTIADIAIFPFMRQFSNVEPDWWNSGPYPKTLKWLSQHVESELFKSIMIKYPLWTSL
ncbi:glutathione S-transferase [Hellea balneolensis]|uniref:glutathione S-transferase n=1 Tax=Hellea balneolensis TaxID=287478 RepID=UPI0003FE2D60|nr:glutathione S-transferase [Hellea balneolensis]